MIFQSTVSRRSFLYKGYKAGLAVALGSWSCGATRPREMTYIENMGVQLYTLRDALKEDIPSALNQLASLGIRNLEMADQERLDTLPATALELGMQVSSLHLNHALITDPSPKRELEASSILKKAARQGIRYAIIAWLPEEHRGDLDLFAYYADRLNNLGKIGAEAGIQVGYHHHAFEFKPENGRTPFEVLMEDTDPNLVVLELDTFWCAAAGKDPLAVMDQYANRIRLLHLKDIPPGLGPLFNNAPEDAFLEVGSGRLDFEAVLFKARAIGVTNVYIEQDHTPGPPLESIQKSYQYLQELGL